VLLLEQESFSLDEAALKLSEAAGRPVNPKDLIVWGKRGQASLVVQAVGRRAVGLRLEASGAVIGTGYGTVSGLFRPTPYKLGDVAETGIFLAAGLEPAGGDLGTQGWRIDEPTQEACRVAWDRWEPRQRINCVECFLLVAEIKPDRRDEWKEESARLHWSGLNQVVMRVANAEPSCADPFDLADTLRTYEAARDTWDLSHVQFSISDLRVTKRELDRLQRELSAHRGRQHVDEPADPRSARTLNRLIRVLAAEAQVDLSQHHKAAGIVAEMAARHGLVLPTPETVARALRAAALVDQES
jgi:hypothetical protein